MSQISDDRIIVIRFMVNADVTEHLLLHGMGDEPIFVEQMSQVVKHNENIIFSDINGTS